MANWCENQIRITGEPDKMKVLVDKFKELETNDQPVMGFLLGTDDYDQGGWYDYNIEKFGTKWDFGMHQVYDFSITKEVINLNVDTAWAPPLTFLESLCFLFNVNATITYSEPGGDFAGKFGFSPDGVVESLQTTYMEGKYRFEDNFWNEVEFNIDSAIDADQSFDEFKEDYAFLVEDDMKQLEKLFNEIKEKY